MARREKRQHALPHSEALKRFGERGYLLAVNAGRVNAFAAWEAENLVALVGELWAESESAALVAIPKLFDLIEEEARALVCEVIVVFLEPLVPSYVSEQLRLAGYLLTDLSELHPMWQQVSQDRFKPGELIVAKRLRESLVTKPV